jgi:hypothetical protein
MIEPKISPDRYPAIKQQVIDGLRTADIAANFGIGISTLKKIIDRYCRLEYVASKKLRMIHGQSHRAGNNKHKASHMQAATVDKRTAKWLNANALDSSKRDNSQLEEFTEAMEINEAVQEDRRNVVKLNSLDSLKHMADQSTAYLIMPRPITDKQKAIVSKQLQRVLKPGGKVKYLAAQEK